MIPDLDTCYRALVARDLRFDGLFFVGVTTSGAYCRPVCRTRTPRRDRCRFFATAADAERDGFRACSRCRPELAPGSAEVDAVPRRIESAVPPAGVRRDVAGRGVAAEAPLRLWLDYRPPLPWDRLLSFLALRAVPGVEAVDAGSYRRVASLDGRAGWVTVEHDATRDALVVTASLELADVLATLASRLRRLFDLDARSSEIDSLLARDETLRAHVRAVPGLRVPGAFDGFEAATRAVLGQQVTVKGAATLAGRLAARFGDAVEAPLAGLRHAFPAPGALAARTPEEVGSLGMPLARARAVVALARAVCDGLVLDPGVDVELALERLRGLPGFGEWTVQYVAMRALSFPDAFPATDLGVRRALGVTRPKEALARAEAWRPWRAYAVLRLWTRAAGGRANPRAARTVRREC